MENRKRYKKTVFCVVEGQQEELYLKHLANLLTDFPTKVVKFNIVKGNADKLRGNGIEYDSVCVFDHDFDDALFSKNLETCIELDRKFSRKPRENGHRVHHAFSNVCFDLWLLLHKRDFKSPINTTDGYVKEIRKAFDLPDDADIKSKKTIEEILGQITLDDVYDAISRAESIKASKLGRDLHRTSKGAEYYDNPDMSIHIFMKELISEVIGSK